MGLLVLAFSPMIYLGLGAYYSITRPLSDKAISRVMVRVNWATALVALFGCLAALKSADVCSYPPHRGPTPNNMGSI